MSLILLLLACASDLAPAEATIRAAAAEVYIAEMWSQRALTLESGLEEAQALYDEGRREEAQDLVDAVYRGSFEPELEPLIRQHLDSRRAAQLEYRFGQLRESMGRRDPVVVASRMRGLLDQIAQAAEELDGLQAVLGG